MRLALALLAALAAGPAPAQHRAAEADVTAARYAEPTRRYDHGVLGDDVEWGALVLELDRCPGCARPDRARVTLRLPETRVFEDLAPRLADLDGDGRREVITVESDLARGARLAIYGPRGLVAATPFIGRPHRWLAPVGAADLDGDGRTEIAYVDRPHLAKVLRIWRVEDGRLTHLADLPGHTNHRIGEDRITGGVRACGGAAPEILTAGPDWTRLLATTFDGTRARTRDLGPFSATAMTRALACGG